MFWRSFFSSFPSAQYLQSFTLLQRVKGCAILLLSLVPISNCVTLGVCSVYHSPRSPAHPSRTLAVSVYLFFFSREPFVSPPVIHLFFFPFLTIMLEWFFNQLKYRPDCEIFYTTALHIDLSEKSHSFTFLLSLPSWLNKNRMDSLSTLLNRNA